MKFFIPKLFALSIILSATNAYAIRAQQDIIRYVQPSGDTVSVQLFGDEKFHWYKSSDGYPLISDNQTLYFAQENEYGEITQSDYPACDKKFRAKDVNIFLSCLNQQKIESTLVERQHTLYQEKKRKTHKVSADDQFGLLPNATYPRYGSQRALIILVEYQDVKFKTNYNPSDYFTRLLNEPDFKEYGATGSAKDYFISNSGGLFNPEFEVYGPVTLPNNMAYYGGNDRYGSDSRPAEMVITACNLIDPYVDFTDFDRDEDGVIDNVFIFYAGRGEASGGSEDSIWPHAWDIREYSSQDYIFDNKRLGRYACTNEQTSEGIEGIGTFIHEFSHVLGLPDLYSTEYTKVFTPGAYSVMDYGSYSNKGRTPSNYSSFERYALGWISPIIIGSSQEIKLNDISSNEATIIRTDNPNEIFFLENRQQYGWDKYLPGHGMLVWHVDYQKERWNKNSVNTSLLKQYVDIIEADNIPTEQTRAGDTFPGTNNITELSAASHRTMMPYTGQDADLPISDITENSGIISFKVAPDSIKLKPPHSVKIRNITDTGLRLVWKGDYEKYLVTLNNQSYYTSDTTVVINDLIPASDYIIRVYGNDGERLSPSSTSIKVKTKGSNQTDTPKEILVDKLSPNTYKLSWGNFENIDNIIIDIYTKEPGDPIKTINNFSEQSEWESNGWSVTPVIPSRSEGYFGETSPSVVFMSIGGRIESPKFTDDIKTINYWCRGWINLNAKPIVTTEQLISSGSWETIDKRAINPNPKGENVFITINQKNVKSIRLNIECPEQSRCYIDDVSVSHGQTIKNTSLDGFPKALGTAELFIFQTNDNQDYYCRIWGEKSGITTHKSDECHITARRSLMNNINDGTKTLNIKAAIGGVTIVTAHQERIDIYDSKGNHVNSRIQEPEIDYFYSLDNGFYLIRNSVSTNKIIISD